MAGLYIHIPFCRTFCNYCDFHSSLIGAALPGKMLDAMLGEMEQRRDFLSAAGSGESGGSGGHNAGSRIETIYFGGGTPSLCRPEELGAFIRRAGELFDTSQLGEVTAEANPDDITPHYLDGLLSEGVNRLSIGIQSFDDGHLRWMNRRHTAAAGAEAVKAAHQAGFKEVSLDLIYGLKPLTAAAWRQNLEQAVELAPQHISAYHLTIEPDTPFGRRAAGGEELEISQEMSVEQFEILREVLLAAGYEHYEVSNFALPGHRAIHNSNYWKGHEYLGIGPAAHSYNGAVRTWNIADNRRYMELQPSGRHFESEELSLSEQYNEYIMLSLRCDTGINAREIEARFGERRFNYFLAYAVKLVAKGLLSREGDNFTIPAANYFISDGVISSLFYE